MRAVVFDHPGDPSVLRIGEVDPPSIGPNDVRIRVAATSVNRADLLQREGRYPPPVGASPILGLECAGEVIETGTAVTEWEKGDRVMALLPGGGYAEEAVVDAGSVMRVPDGFSIEEAGAFPEVFLTAFLNLFLLGDVAQGMTVLVHGGGSGVGTAAITLCRESRIRVLVTAGSDEKCARAAQLGAEAINYRTEDFSKRAVELTRGEGVNVILDHIGGEYLERNLAALSVGGKLVVIGAMRGRQGTLDIGRLLSRRLQVIGSTLRGRPRQEKASIVRMFLARFGVPLEKGKLRPVIDRVLPLEEAAEAHRIVDAGEHFGKVGIGVG